MMPITKNAGTKHTINIDVLAENVKLPFASFVDQKMVKEARRQEILKNTIHKEMVRVQKQY